MEIIAQHGTTLLILAGVFGLFMAWGIGANDVANAMGTSVGSRALTLKQAIIIAAIMEFAGAYLAGGEVTSTIRKGIIDPLIFEDNPEWLVYGMSAALLAAGTWLLIASRFGWPVSTTHSIVGAIVGFAAVGVSAEAVAWGKVSGIVASWVVSPLLSGTMAFLLFVSAHKFILNTETPFLNAKRYIPVYMFLTGFLISMVTLVKGLKHVGLDLNYGQALLYAALVGVFIALMGKFLMRNVQEPKFEAGHRFDGVEKIFAVLMIFTASAMAFAHGSNDVANAIGPLAAVYSTIQSGGIIASTSGVPPWILLVGGIGIIIGLATYGYKVMATIGKRITELTPSRGFAAELGAAGTVVLASGTGLPVSTTHCLVGAVLGVGLARGIGALDLRVVGTIGISWVVTLPAGAGLSILFFFMLNGMFG